MLHMISCRSRRIDRRCPLSFPALAAPESRCPRRAHSAVMRCPRCKAELVLASEGRIITARPGAIRRHRAATARSARRHPASEASSPARVCDQIHHRECWADVGGCATYGCENAAKSEKAAAGRDAALGLGRHQEVPGLRGDHQGDRTAMPILRDRFRYRGPAQPRRICVKRVEKEEGSQSTRSAGDCPIRPERSGLPGPDRGDRRACYILPKRATIAKAGPIYLVMGYSAIGISVVYSILMPLFWLFSRERSREHSGLVGFGSRTIRPRHRGGDGSLEHVGREIADRLDARGGRRMSSLCGRGRPRRLRRHLPVMRYGASSRLLG